MRGGGRAAAPGGSHASWGSNMKTSVRAFAHAIPVFIMCLAYCVPYVLAVVPEMLLLFSDLAVCSRCCLSNGAR